MALNVGGSKALYWKTGIDNKGLKEGSAETKGILKGLAGNVSKLDVFAGLGASAAMVFAKISKKAFEFSKSFETAMKEVQTISKAVQVDYNGVSQAIIDMSKNTPEKADQLTKAFYQIVSAGYDGAEGMKVLEASTKLAVGGVTDTFIAADTLTSIMNAYGDKAGTALEISDKLFTTVKLGKIDMTQLGSSLGQVTGLAAQAGLDFDSLMTMVAKGTKTMKPEQMITGIRGILNAIIKGPLDKAKEVVDELGLEFGLTALKTKGFAGFMEELIEKTGGSIESLQKLFPDVQGLAGFLAIATEEGGSFRDMLGEMGESLGATDEAFATMVSSTDNQLKILQNHINAKLKGFGDVILNSVNGVAGSINKMFVDVVKEQEKASRNERIEFEKNIILLDKLREKTDKTAGEKDLLAKAIQSLQNKYPSYLGSLDLEKGKYNDIEIAINKTREALIKKSAQEMVMAKQEESIKEIAELEVKRVETIEKEAEAQALATLADEKRMKAKKDLLATEKYSDLAGKPEKDWDYDREVAFNTELSFIQDLSLAEIQSKETVKRIQEKILKITEKIEKKNQELASIAKTYADIMNGTIEGGAGDEPNGSETPNSDSGDTSTTTAIVDKTAIQSQLQALKDSLKTKEQLLREAYDTNKAFIQASVEDEKEKQELLLGIERTYIKDVESLRKQELEAVWESSKKMYDLGLIPMTELKVAYTEYREVLKKASEDTTQTTGEVNNLKVELQELDNTLTALGDSAGKKPITKSLSEITSAFGEQTKQLEELRQAGIDTTTLLEYEWKQYAEQIGEEYGYDSLRFKAVLNMKKDAEQEYLEWRQNQWKEQNEFENGILQVGLNSYKSFVNTMLQEDMTGKERRQVIWDSMKSGFVNLLADMTAKLIEQAILNALIGKTAESTAIASAIITGSAVASAWSTAAAMTSLATLGANSIPASAGIISTTSLAKALSLGTGMNDGGELQIGSNQNKDSVPVWLTKREIVINRDSSQANNGENRRILLGINQDKDYIKKHFLPRNLGGEVSISHRIKEPMIYPSTKSFPSIVNINSNQLSELVGAVKAQTMNQQRQQTVTNLTIRSSIDSERFIIETEKTKANMKKRGYNFNE